MTTGKQLRSLRTKKQVSQKLLAQCGSWSSAYVHKLEQSRSVSVSQVTRYAAALDAASARVTESRAKEERDSQAVLSRFEVPAPTSTPAPPTPLEVHRRNSLSEQTPAAPSFTLNSPPKTSSLTLEAVKEILDTAFGSPEAQDGFLTYKLPRGPMTHPGFVSVSRETWNVRTELPGQAMMKVTEGSDFDELISHLRGLRLLKI